MKCEAVDFNDVEWNFKPTDKSGDWQGRPVCIVGADPVVQQVYRHSRTESDTVGIRLVIADYSPDENTVGNDSSSSSADWSGGYDASAYYHQDREGNKSVGVRGGLDYRNDSNQGYVKGHVGVDEDGKVSGSAEVGFRRDF